MELIRETLTAGQKPTKAQLEEVRRAARMPITFDEDCPELTDEQLAEFRRVADTSPEERRRLAQAGRLINVTIDADIFDWLKQNNMDYQTQVNHALRQAMKEQ